MPTKPYRDQTFRCLQLTSAAVILVATFACAKNDDSTRHADGERRAKEQQATLENGKTVFRFETFGNEGFWTDAVRLPQGLAAAKVTPMQALNMGLSINTERLDEKTIAALKSEIQAKGTSGPLLNSYATTVKLLNANAVIGMVVIGPDGLEKPDIRAGAKAGVSCVLCHATTDHSVLKIDGGGSMGVEIDGPANHEINMGGLFAMAKNTKALFPMAQIKGADGKSIGRAPSDQGLTKDSTEAEFDAYFGNPVYYPRGMFDDTVDGNGNPMHNTPMFRADLSAPFGSAGELETVEQFSNTVYTVLLDMTDLTTAGGKAFLHKAAGKAGDQLAKDYAEILKGTRVAKFPYVRSRSGGMPGTQDTLIGLRVDDQKLSDEAAYLKSLRSPAGVILDAVTTNRGRKVFASAQCTSCHGASQSVPVATTIFPLSQIFPGDRPTVLAPRDTPLSPVEDTPGNTFDDKMIVINASLRGSIRGSALPLLMDLARKPVFLHDNSVATLDDLLSSSRGMLAPHPFYVDAAPDRADLIAFLNSLDDTK